MSGARRWSSLSFLSDAEAVFDVLEAYDAISEMPGKCPRKFRCQARYAAIAWFTFRSTQHTRRRLAEGFCSGGVPAGLPAARHGLLEVKQPMFERSLLSVGLSIASVPHSHHRPPRTRYACSCQEFFAQTWDRSVTLSTKVPCLIESSKPGTFVPEAATSRHPGRNILASNFNDRAENANNRAG